MWTKLKLPLAFIACVGLVFFGAMGQAVFAKKAETKLEDLPLEELRAFTDVFARIKSDYVENVTDKELLENAIRGMLAGLDPHSAYLDMEEYNDLNVSTSGEFGGLGIEVSISDGFIRVVSPIDDTPAQRAGILSGDTIIRINDTPIKGMMLDKAIKKMRGKPGSEVTITVMRENSEEPIDFTLKRAIIKVNSIKSRFLMPGYAYVRISQFQYNTSDELLEAIEDLLKENNGKLSGLILDLRNNPGGILDAAIGVSDAFIDEGVIVSHAGRASDANRKYSASPDDILKGSPLAVLVNGGSASASEIVAGAIQDHQRGIIVGTKTFGKGSVQTVLPLGDGSGLKLTTAKYFTPKGRSIQAEGIQPDILIDANKIRVIENRSSFSPIKESDLEGHLDNPKGNSKTAATSTPGDETDYALQEALNLLKALNILKGEPAAN